MHRALLKTNLLPTSLDMEVYLSLLLTNIRTDLTFILGSKPIPALERLPRVQLRYLPEPPMLQALPFIVLAPIKIIHQIVCILFILLVQIAKPPEFILVQVISFLVFRVTLNNRH
jgi:hypothetical protein